MELTTSQIKYLLVIYELREQKTVRSLDIANALQVKKPSTHRALLRLADLGLINKEYYGQVELTADGKRIAAQYHRLHGLVMRFFAQTLGLEADTAWQCSALLLGDLKPDCLLELESKLKSWFHPVEFGAVPKSIQAML